MSTSPLHSHALGFKNALYPSTKSRELSTRGRYFSLRASLRVLIALFTHLLCCDFALYFEMVGGELCIGIVYRTNPYPMFESDGYILSLCF